MNISDYIPNYPELNDPQFNNKILHKKEFYDLRTNPIPNPPGVPGDLWPHQQLLSRVVSPYTDYNEQLLFHTPGTGKTCAASAIVEVSRQDPQVRKPVLIIVPNETLVNQWKQQIARVCTAGQYVPEDFFNLTAGERTVRLNKLIKAVYHITTLEKLNLSLKKLNDKTIHDKYSNTIIIIDEAHNLRIESHSSDRKEAKTRYESFHKFLHLVENCKKILLTGTPMYDRVTELPGLMNLLLPLDNQMPTGRIFTQKFLEKKGNIRVFKNKSELFKYFVGKVSYIREGGNFPTRIDIGEPVWTKFIKNVVEEMSADQLAGYFEAYNKDRNISDITPLEIEESEEAGDEVEGVEELEELVSQGTEEVERVVSEAPKKRVSTGLWKNSRQAACFVYTDSDGNHHWGQEAYNVLATQGNAKSIRILNKRVKYNPMRIKDQFRDDLRDNLANYSSKFNKIINYITENRNSPIFIFTPLVSGAGGAKFLGLLLELFGYEKALGNTSSPRLRYAIITGDDNSSLQRKELIRIYNSEENRNGEIIQVMIATKTIAEGTSFINVQKIIVAAPYWNNSGTEQAIGRGLRADSLLSLPEDMRIVDVLQLAIISDDLPEDQNIDANMYKMSERKDFEIKAGERILQQVSWDCALNYDRNVRINDSNDSRSCNYQKCNYVCYQTTPEKVLPKWKYTVKKADLDESTYLLYYSRPELLKLVEKIKEILKTYTFINIQGLYTHIKSLKNFKLLVLAIEYIIENHVTVFNKWGQPCFLRKQGNLLFLSDLPIETSILGSWYSNYPYVNSQTPLSQIVNNELYAQDLAKMDAINLNDPEEAKRLIDSMHLETQIFILESLLTMERDLMTNKQKKLYQIFTDLFGKNIFKIDQMVVHNLEKTKLERGYVDFETGVNGNLKCLKNDTWQVCEKKEVSGLSKVITEIKSDIAEDIKNQYGIYGKITSDGKFQIVDKTKEQEIAKTDKRREFRGKSCVAGWKKWELLNFYTQLGVESPVDVDTTLTNKADLIAIITTNRAARSIPPKATVAMLQKLATLSRLHIRVLCPQLEKWFIDNNLVVRDV